MEPSGFCLARIPKETILPLFGWERAEVLRVQETNEGRRAARISLTCDCFAVRMSQGMSIREE